MTVHDSLPGHQFWWYSTTHTPENWRNLKCYQIKIRNHIRCMVRMMPLWWAICRIIPLKTVHSLWWRNYMCVIYTVWILFHWPGWNEFEMHLKCYCFYVLWFCSVDRPTPCGARQESEDDIICCLFVITVSMQRSSSAVFVRGPGWMENWSVCKGGTEISM